MLVCPCCDGSTRAARTQETRAVAGTTYVVSVVARKCRACKETFVPGKALERVELTIAAALAMDGPPTGETFRFMRKALGIAAMKLAVLLDVAAETLSRWERGQRAVDLNAWLTVGTLVLERVRQPVRIFVRLTTLRAKQKQKQSQKRPKTIELTLL
jgi:hypothetical protein